MIEHIWTVLCSMSVIDRDTNNVSLFNVLEQLNITGPSFPEGKVGLLPINAEVVTLWARTHEDRPTRGRARLLFLAPSGLVEDFHHEYDVDLSSYQRSRTRTKLHGLAVREPGRHHFRVQLWDESEGVWRDVADVPLQVVITPSGP